MVQLFEDYPVTESLLLWYPVFIVVAELTLPFIQCNVHDSIQQKVVCASTAFFLTLVNVETWHFMMLYVLALPQSALYLSNEHQINSRQSRQRNESQGVLLNHTI